MYDYCNQHLMIFFKLLFYIQRLVVPNDTSSIHSIFQKSYPYEAALIGIPKNETHTFPPLTKNEQEIATSSNDFFGLYDHTQTLRGVVEIKSPDYYTNQTCYIKSLVVDPAFFRKNVATQLLEFVFKYYNTNSHFYVETALQNTPAIKLYTKHKFRLVHEYIAENNITKVAFLR